MSSLGGNEVFRLFGTIEVGRQKFASDMKAMEKRVAGFAAKVSKGFDKATKGIERHAGAIRGVGMAMTAMGATMAAGITKTVGLAADFQQEMRNVNVIMRESEEGFAAVSARVLDLSTKLPQSATVLARALYNIGSSGFKGAEGLHLLETSARAAVAGVTETDVAAKALTTVLNAYGLAASEAGRVSDVLFKTVERGVLTFPELAENLGQVISSAAAAGVPIEHVAAAFATMTKSGINAAEASTALNRAILTFLSPSEEFAQAVRDITGEEASAIIQTKGLGGAVEVLNQIAGENPAILANVGLEMRALKAAMSLAREEGTVFQADMQAMATASGAAASAFEEQSKAFAVQWDLMKSSMAAAAITIGSTLMPKLRPLIDLIGDIATNVARWAEENSELATALTVAAAAVAGLMVALGPLLIILPGLVTAIGLVGTALGALAIAAVPLAIAALVALAGVITLKLVGAHRAEARATEKATEAYREHVKEMLTLAERAEELAEKKERTKEETDELKKAMARLKDEYPELLRFYSDEADATEELIGLLKVLRVERLKILSIEEAGERRRTVWLGRRIAWLSDWIDVQNRELASRKAHLEELIRAGQFDPRYIDEFSQLSAEYTHLERSVEKATGELEGLQKELVAVSGATIKTGEDTDTTGGQVGEFATRVDTALKNVAELTKELGLLTPSTYAYVQAAKELSVAQEELNKLLAPAATYFDEIDKAAADAAKAIRDVGVKTAQVLGLARDWFGADTPKAGLFGSLTAPPSDDDIAIAAQMYARGLEEVARRVREGIEESPFFRGVGIFEDLLGAMPSVDESVTATVSDMQAAEDAAVASAEANKEIQDKLEADAKARAEATAAAWERAAERIQDALAGAFRRILLEGGKFSDALSTIWDTMKTMFAEALAAMVAEWIAAQMKMLAIKLVTSLFGIPMGEGGIVTQPTLAVVGEAGPEAVVPLPASPATMAALPQTAAAGAVGEAAGGIHLHGDLNVELTADSLDPRGVQRLGSRLVEPLGEALRRSLLSQVVGA